MDGGGGADLLVGLEAALAVHQVGREDSVDERRLAETRLAWSRAAALALDNRGRPQGQLTDTDDIKLEAPLH